MIQKLLTKKKKKATLWLYLEDLKLYVITSLMAIPSLMDSNYVSWDVYYHLQIYVNLPLHLWET